MTPTPQTLRSLVVLVSDEVLTPELALRLLEQMGLVEDTEALDAAVIAYRRAQALREDYNNVHSYVDVDPGQSAVGIARVERQAAEDELTECVRKLATPREQEARVAS